MKSKWTRQRIGDAIRFASEKIRAGEGSLGEYNEFADGQMLRLENDGPVIIIELKISVDADA